MPDDFVMLTKAEAEELITGLVLEIEAIRLSAQSEEEKASQIEMAEIEIASLKEITGPRNITGTAGI